MLGNTHYTTNNIKQRYDIKKLLENKGDNWLGKMYQQFQLHGSKFNTELDLNVMPDPTDIMNCLSKFRQTDKHLVKECEKVKNNDFEYKQSEIDEDDNSKLLWEEIDTTLSIMTDEDYFIMYIPFVEILIFRVDKKCDFFMIEDPPKYLRIPSKNTKICTNYNVDDDIKSIMTAKNKSEVTLPVIGFYIRAFG